MTALHRVKAYFGMVPADELDSYDGYDSYADYDRYRGSDRRDRYESDRYDGPRYDAERHDGDRRRDRLDGHYESDRHSSRFEEREAAEVRSRAARSREADLADAEAPDAADAIPASRSSSRGRSWAQNTGPNHGSVRSVGSSGPSRSSLATAGSSSGSSAGAPAAAMASVGAGASSGGGGSAGTSAASTASAPSTRGALAVDDSRRRDLSSVATPAESAAPVVKTAAPAEITTLQPTSYNEARVIGEKYRDGIPVIINLTELDDVAAKRLVDFAAGLAFALRGSIEKVTNRVFLLSPPNVEVSAADRKKFAEGALSASS